MPEESEGSQNSEESKESEESVESDEKIHLTKCCPFLLFGLSPTPPTPSFPRQTTYDLPTAPLTSTKCRALPLSGEAGWWEGGGGVALAKGTDLGQGTGHAPGQGDAPCGDWPWPGSGGEWIFGG